MGTEQITNRILSDARAELETQRQAIAADRAARAAELKASALAEADAIAKKAEADAAENDRRRMLVASLEARKNSLSSRRDVLEAAFKGAYSCLLALPDDQYVDLLTLVAAASGARGDEAVFVPLGAGERFCRLGLLENFNRALGAKLSYAGELGTVRSGMLLSGELTDIDCSFEALLSTWREQHEAEVAALLFESEV